MERKKIRSECEFIGLKDNRLNYKCKECNETSAKSINDLIEKFPRVYKFCNGSSGKKSYPGHFLKSHENKILTFLYTLFKTIFTYLRL